MENNGQGYRFFRPIIGFFIKLLYRPKVINKNLIPLNGPVILAGNHRHNFDPLLVGISTKRTIHFLAKKELHDSKFGWFYRFVGTIPVDRSKKDQQCQLDAINFLKSGNVVGIFPEGTSNKVNDNLLPFKFGTVSMAQKSGAVIIPFGTKGQYKIFHKSNLTIKFGKPFKILKNMSLEEANEKLREYVEELKS